MTPQRPMLFHAKRRGVALLDQTVDAFARTGSVRQAAISVGITTERCKVVSDFLFDVLGLPRGPHGGRRHGDGYRHPSADLAPELWSQRRASIVASYGGSSAPGGRDS